VCRALLDARAIAKWKVPNGMRRHVHEFDACQGGAFRISLSDDAPTGTGNTTPHSDTRHGRFVRLVPNEQLVEVDEFETADPSLRGEMTVSNTLTDRAGGPDLLAVYAGLVDAARRCSRRKPFDRSSRGRRVRGLVQRRAIGNGRLSSRRN
jgi:uncharacterized protein YndB with AHSA1/START domain